MRKFIVCLLCLFLLSGCMALLPVEDEVLPPLTQQPPPMRPFRTALVTRGDVMHYSNPMATHVPAQEEELFFSTPNLYVRGIYVQVGDVVQVGDLVAELYMPNIQNRLITALQDEEWALLDLAQARARHERALDAAELSGVPVDDSGYLREIENILARLDIINMRLEYLRRRDTMRYVYATIGGIVTQARVFQNNLRSDAMYQGNSHRQPVVTITDQSRSVFVVQASEANYMYPGDRFIMHIDEEPFHVIVVDPEDYGITRPPIDSPVRWAYLTLIDSVPPPGMQRANVEFIAEAVYDVLYVPLRAVRRSAQRAFVYVMEDDVRVPRDVTVGLRGRITYEILDGLYEGEVVIID